MLSPATGRSVAPARVGTVLPGPALVLADQPGDGSGRC